MAKYNFPETLIGDDIILEKLSEFHADDLYELLDENRAHIANYLPWMSESYNKDDLFEFIENANNDWMDDITYGYVIINKETDLPMGSIGVTNRSAGAVELGYYLGQNFTGKGYISQAVNMLEEEMFTNMPIVRINISTVTDNLNSAMVAKRNGFYFEGLILDKRLEGNKHLDMLHFTKLKDQSKMNILKEIEPKLIDIFDVKMLKNK